MAGQPATGVILECLLELSDLVLLQVPDFKQTIGLPGLLLGPRRFTCQLQRAQGFATLVVIR
ncbi:hypothetical protein D3C84_1008350 [compost metagenome]